MDSSSSSLTKPWRSPVEEVLMGHIEKIQEANKLPNKDATYEYIIEHWFMYDANWLRMIQHMKENNRFQ